MTASPAKDSPIKIGAIAAMTRSRLIGVDNDIPWHYPEDFKRFKRVTLHSSIIMGRKTWESIGSKPLPKRQNIVLTRGNLAGVETADSIEKALQIATQDIVWFIGGGHVYTQALPYCQMLDITWVPDQPPLSTSQTGAYFPKIPPNEWTASAESLLETDTRLSLQTFNRKTKISEICTRVG